MSEHLHALSEGTLLEGYRIERVLGVGGFGITYLARDTDELGKYFAIKEYLPNEFAIRTEASTVLPKSTGDEADYDWGLDRFLDEAKTLATFDHPNLNTVFRFFRANGTAYMVLEYIEGETLSAKLKRDKTLSESELDTLLQTITTGLEVVHQAGYVHRDIKPGNLMIKPNGSYVLLDFGAARAAIGQRSKSITAILTPGYAPVEQYDQSADDIGPWTDIYALGMVAYRCISGCSDGGLKDAVARARLLHKGQTQDDMKSAQEVGKGRFSRELLKAIDWAIQVNEEDRPQTITELQGALFSVEPVANNQTTKKQAEPKQPDKIIEPSGSTMKGVVVTLIIGLCVTGLLYGLGIGPFKQKAVEPEVIAVAEENTNSAIQSAEIEIIPDAPPVVEPDAVIASKEDPEIARLLESCANHLAANRLTTGAAGNAADCYGSVLEKDPNNQTALEGFSKIEQAYIKLTKTAIAASRLKSAESYRDKLEALNSKHAVLPQLTAEIKAARQADQKPLASDALLQKYAPGIELIEIPSGSFRMGDLSGVGGSDEKPVHQVKIKDFKLMKHEVTFAQYDQYSEATGKSKPSDGGWGRGKRPVSKVNWHDATAYAKWLSQKTGLKFRLPSEAEWEYAARAGTRTKYSWGNSIGNNKANCDGCGSQWDNRQTAPVGSFPANQFGLKDMHGNVWEWVQDCWNGTYNGAPQDGSAWMSGDCSERVLRGGSWYSGPYGLRSAFRFDYTADARGHLIGFRLLQDP